MLNYNEIMFLKEKMPIKVDMIYDQKCYFGVYVLISDGDLTAITFENDILRFNDKDNVKFSLKND